MLRPLAFVAVREQQHETAVLLPLVLGGHEELVDDDLGAVGEVAELGLPDGERLGVGDRIAVFEAEHRVFAEQRVVNPEVGVLVGQRAEQDVLGAGLEVDQCRMPMAEGAPTRVLPRKTDRGAFAQQRSHRHCLAERPVDLACCEHLVALRELLCEFRVNDETLRRRGQRVVDAVDGRLVDRRAQVGEYAHRLNRRLRPGIGVIGDIAGLVERGLESGPEVLEGGLFLLRGQIAALHQ